MLFNTVDYWLFFFTVLALFYSLPFRIGKVFLLLASYFFYMCWDPRFIVLILASTVIDYVLGILLESARGPRRKLWLISSLVVNLGILCFFKYYNFFAASLATLLRVPESSFLLNIILPIGVSFYTFASLSYTIDVYWGKMKAVRNFIDYAFFIAFFPHLVSGPIIRASQFIVQIEKWRRPARVFVQVGVTLILSGLVKKMVFADRFGIISDNYFGSLDAHPGWLAAWSGVFAFSMQAFFDFSGYTDIARGCARLLGFEFPENFERPFLSRNISELWRRWHITLGYWLRDYLYIPLGGSRGTRWQTYRNLLVTMTLVGLWHGAHWTYAVFGAYQGVLLIGHRIFREVTAKSAAVLNILANRYFVPFGILLTFLTFVVGMALLRASSLEQSGTILHAMFDFRQEAGQSLLTAGTIVLFGTSLIIAVVEERHCIIERLATAPARYQIPAFFFVFLALELFSVPLKVPFIYFQF
jgi:alginate O-acetyltransferase complex protein AlgI